MITFEMDKMYMITGRELLALLSLTSDGVEEAEAIMENVAGRAVEEDRIFQYPVNDPIYKKGVLKLPKLSEEECESLRKAIEESDAVPQIYLPPQCDNCEGKAVVKDIDGETVETMLTTILDEIGQMRKAIAKGGKE